MKSRSFIPYLISFAAVLAATKAGDLIIGGLDRGISDGGWDSAKEQRSIILREHAPNLDFWTAPDASYLSGADGLTAKKIHFRTDGDGFIVGPDEPGGPAEIIFVGGSTTECLYVDEDKRFPYLVARNLSQSIGRPLTTLNAGVSGNHTVHSLLSVVAKGLKYKPKVVVLMENVNDLSLLTKSTSYWAGPKSRALVQSTPVKRSVSGMDWTKTTVEFALPNIYRRASALGGAQSIDEFEGMRGAPPLPKERLAAQFHASLSGMVVMLKQWGVKPVLMTQFNRLQKSDTFIRTHYGIPENMTFDLFVEYYHAFNDVIRTVAREQQIPLIDLDSSIPKDRTYLYDAVHLNNEGSILAARQIADRLHLIRSDLGL